MLNTLPRVISLYGRNCARHCLLPPKSHPLNPFGQSLDLSRYLLGAGGSREAKVGPWNSGGCVTFFWSIRHKRKPSKFALGEDFASYRRWEEYENSKFWLEHTLINNACFYLFITFLKWIISFIPIVPWKQCKFTSDLYTLLMNSRNALVPLSFDFLSSEGNDRPLQYSCLENSMGRGAWQATAPGVPKSRTQLSDWHFYFYLCSYSCVLTTGRRSRGLEENYALNK